MIAARRLSIRKTAISSGARRPMRAEVRATRPSPGHPKYGRFIYREPIIQTLVCVIGCFWMWLGCTSPIADSLSKSPAISNRIVSLSPNITEVLFALGAGPRVIAVTRFCDYPADALALPKIGGFIDPSFEAIVSQRPDLVIGTKNTAADGVATRLSDAGIAVHLFPMETLADTRSAIQSIATLIGNKKQGDELVTQLDAGLADVAARVQQTQRRRVVVLFGHRPMVIAGPHTFVDELITLAGGINIAAGAKLAYPTWSPEAVAAALPDVIIDTSMGSETVAAADFALQWERWVDIPAVKRKQIVHLADTSLLRPGPRLVQGLLILAKTIHPEAFETK